MKNKLFIIPFFVFFLFTVYGEITEYAYLVEVENYTTTTIYPNSSFFLFLDVKNRGKVEAVEDLNVTIVENSSVSLLNSAFVKKLLPGEKQTVALELFLNKGLPSSTLYLQVVFSYKKGGIEIKEYKEIPIMVKERKEAKLIFSFPPFVYNDKTLKLSLKIKNTGTVVLKNCKLSIDSGSFLSSNDMFLKEIGFEEKKVELSLVPLKGVKGIKEFKVCLSCSEYSTCEEKKVSVRERGKLFISNTSIQSMNEQDKFFPGDEGLFVVELENPTKTEVLDIKGSIQYPNGIKGDVNSFVARISEDDSETLSFSFFLDKNITPGIYEISYEVIYYDKYGNKGVLKGSKYLKVNSLPKPPCYLGSLFLFLSLVVLFFILKLLKSFFKRRFR